MIRQESARLRAAGRATSLRRRSQHRTLHQLPVVLAAVSTTHVLSSGLAGTMVANGSGIQKETVRNIILAWVLTLPVCVLLGASLFAAGLLFVLRVAGVP